MVKKYVVFLCLLCMVLPAFSQVTGDALALFRSGRTLEGEGKIAQANGDYEKSVAICREELKINNKNMESYVVLGWSLFRLKRFSESISVSLEALKINPREYRVIESLAEAYFYTDNYKESLKNFEKYLDVLPNGERAATAYFFVGEIYRLQNQFNHADIAYTAAVRKEPGIALWWYRLGLAREAAGDKNGARSAFQRTLSLQPTHRDADEGLKRLL